MRIFLLGDSFTDNLYKRALKTYDKDIKNYPDGITQYIKLLRDNNLDDPLYFDDYLRLWGYDVINLGLGGSSVYTICNQFAKIDREFEKNDRIIINWTSPCRFDWLLEDGENRCFTGGAAPKEVTDIVTIELFEQSIRRMDSYLNKNGYLFKELVPFMCYLVNLHTRYRPIMWSPFDDVSNLISNNEWYFWEPSNIQFKNIIPEFDKLTIYQETNGKINDRHYGRYGNFYLALIYKTILENTNIDTPFYTKDLNLIFKIFETLKSESHNILSIFKSLI